jgi:hypothetical protein
MYVFKKLHAKDPDEAYERIKYSASLHTLLNIIEDFEISNKRYTSEDKKIVQNMQLNGRIIGGLVTEDHRNWDTMSLEQMYEELSNELIKINSAIRSDPYWQPKSGAKANTIDPIEYKSAEAIMKYRDYMRPSSIKAPIDIFMKTKIFNRWPDTFKKLVANIYNAFKDFTSDADKQLLLDIIKDVADTSPQETFEIVNPKATTVVCKLYTPEDKQIASDILKNLCGNINYDPLKFKVKRKTNSQEYKDAWNKAMKQLDSSKFDDDTLTQLQDAIKNA